MNSLSCANIILKNIHDNVHLMENNNEVNKLSKIIYKLGGLTIQKPLSCSLLKNILMTLKKLNMKNTISDVDYKNFLRDVSNFYKSQNLCVPYKLSIIPCFTPAVEIELLHLLKLCATVANLDEIGIIRSAVRNSILVQACLESKESVQKIAKILKVTFVESRGNPVVGYLTFHLFNAIEQFGTSCSLSKEVHSLNAFFNFPHHLLSCEEQELFIKQLKNLCVDDINLKLFTKIDLIFYIAAFPAFYHKLLNLCCKNSSNSASDFLKFLCVSQQLESSDWINNIYSAKENGLWKLIFS